MILLRPHASSLSVGMGRYKPVRQAIDLLIQSDNLETLLQRSPAAIESHGVVGRYLTEAKEHMCKSRRMVSIACHEEHIQFPKAETS